MLLHPGFLLTPHSSERVARGVSELYEHHYHDGGQDNLCRRQADQHARLSEEALVHASPRSGVPATQRIEPPDSTSAPTVICAADERYKLHG